MCEKKVNMKNELYVLMIKIAAKRRYAAAHLYFFFCEDFRAERFCRLHNIRRG